MVPTTAELAWRCTPIEALRRWPADRPVMLLLSGRSHARWARWSLLAEPGAAVRCELDKADRPRCWRREADGAVSRLGDDPFAAIDAVARDGVPWIGYVGYDLGRCVETLPRLAVDDRGWPAMQWQRCAGWALHDHQTGRWRAGGAWAEAAPVLLDQPMDAGFEAGGLEAMVSRDRYVADVQRVLDYIAAGDVFQANLAQRWTAPFAGSPRGFTTALVEVSPAWYGAHLELVPLQADESRRVLCSASPELFLECDERRRVTTRPIKGTRPASSTADELAHSGKDAAELAMIVDLLRNDLGRVASFGSLRVESPRDLEAHPTVLHATATVSATLRRGASLADLLRATLPGGSITGAPKVRAMEMIEALEPVRRGPYCGAIGLIQGQTCRLNVAIRTAAVTQGPDGRGTLDASFGAGIVADSCPEAEYEETRVKSEAIRRALAAGRGVVPTPSI